MRTIKVWVAFNLATLLYYTKGGKKLITKKDLILIREISNDIKAQWLLCDFNEEHLQTLLKYNLDLDVHHPKIDEEKIKLCHDNNVKVNIWTVNDQKIANKYASWGVDFITSNWVKNTF